MDGTIENPMVIDWWWDELEYGVPNKSRLKREKQSYEEEEMGGMYEENER